MITGIDQTGEGIHYEFDKDIIGTSHLKSEKLDEVTCLTCLENIKNAKP